MTRFHPRITVFPGKGFYPTQKIFLYHVAYAATDEETWDILRAVAHVRGNGCDCDAHKPDRCRCGGRCGCHRSAAYRDPFKERILGIWFGDPKDTTDAEDDQAFRDMFGKVSLNKATFRPDWYTPITVV